MQEPPKAIRMDEIKNKICNKCATDQPISNFQFRNDSQKYRNECKECFNRSNRGKTYVPGAKQRREELYKQPRKTCKTCNVEKDAEDFAVRSDTGLRRNQCTLCRNAYVAEFKRTEASKAVNRARINERRKTDMDFYIRSRMRSSVKEAVHKRGHLKTGSTVELIGCTVEEFRDHIEKQFTGDMSWEKRNFHLDHIIPCSHFDLSKEEDQKKCFHYTNYQPLTPEENLKKGAKILEEHMHRLNIQVPS